MANATARPGTLVYILSCVSASKAFKPTPTGIVAVLNDFDHAKEHAMEFVEEAKSNLSAAWTTSTEPADGKLSRAGQWVFSALAPGEELVVMVEEHVVRGSVDDEDLEDRKNAILANLTDEEDRERNEWFQGGLEEEWWAEKLGGSAGEERGQGQEGGAE